MNCYLFSVKAGREVDWKSANRHCRKHGAFLAEMESIEENQDIIAHIQNSPYLRGKFKYNVSNLFLYNKF